jgi:hypothetical protein
MADEDDDADPTPRAAAAVEHHWPYHGPYGPYRTAAAAFVIGRLVRYLNNATGNATALPHPSTVGEAITHLRDAARGLDQLLRQLADFSTAQASDNPNLYDDRRDPIHPAGETAHHLAGALEYARAAARELATQLDHAAGYAAHLGVHLPPDDE